MQAPNQPAPQSGMPVQTTGQAPDVSGELQQATPEEQSQYEHFVAKSLDLIYDQAVIAKTVESLKGGGDPIAGLANVSSLVVARVAIGAEKAGEQLSGDVVLHAGTRVFEDLADLSAEFGILDFSQDRDAMESAYYQALDNVRTMMDQAGRINTAAAQADMEKLVQLDQSGQLENLFRALAGDAGPNGSSYAEQSAHPTEPARQRGLLRGNA